MSLNSIRNYFLEQFKGNNQSIRMRILELIFNLFTFPFRKAWSIWSCICSSHIIPALSVLLMTGIGIVGSMRYKEISEKVSPVCDSAKNYWICATKELLIGESLVVIKYLIWTAIILGFCLVTRTYIKAKTYSDSVKELRYYFSSLPPGNIIQHHSRAYVQANNIIFSILELNLNEEEKQDIEYKKTVVDSIKAILKIIGILLHDFEAEGSGKRDEKYSLNIMLFEAIERFGDNPTSQSIRSKFKGLRLLDSGGVEDLRGFLVLYSALSIRIIGSRFLSTQISDIDNTIPCGLCLPVHKKHVDSFGVINSLPGAPTAFNLHTDHPSIAIKDTRSKELWKSWFKKCNYKTETENEILKYFCDEYAPTMGSLLSLPITNTSSEVDGNLLPVGVLNIHCDRRSMLQTHEKDLELFVPLMKPYIAILGRLIEKVEIDDISNLSGDECG
ncbi:hypothetical protein [Aliikangiella coralliicola]|uniref:Uncharacterized protein n=1 Tax=Aliikangiella coralliicola TaxID=2592383 RepID=A0A545U054_9GAMM|nr:hypothetical protein [Aliikangiella coralliicola]TQV82841.1 hypothetical protein FLL46_24030 [Aliikangiella coralliicola]